jgi:hypothetical protein
MLSAIERSACVVEENKRAQSEDEDNTECLLTSKEADGSVRSIGPFSRERAEALVQVYGRMYPNQTCWLEPLAQEVRALHTGRVQRHRGSPILASSGRDY